MGDPRVIVHRKENNVGAEGNFNECIRLAEGKYTAIFHADDLYEPQMVERQVAFLEAHPEAAAVFTEARLVDEHGEIFGQINFPEELKCAGQAHDFDTVFKAVLRHSNFFVCPSAMVRTEVYQQEIRSWRGDLFKSSADLDVWLRIALQHKVGLLSQYLMRYRISASQFSAKVRLQTERPDFFLVIDHYLKLPTVSALLDGSDHENYARLDRRDRVMRAVNWVIAGNPGNARPLLEDICSKRALVAAISTKRGLGVLMAGIYLKLILLLNLQKLGQISLARLKRTLRK